MRESHGESLLPLYLAWRNMKSRCMRKTHPQYHHYGGRGIIICQEWIDSYLTFAGWARANGYKPWKFLDRENNNGNYTPENCRWVIMEVSCNNQRSNVMITAFGETKTIQGWVDDPRCGMSHAGLTKRLQNGNNPERAITMPSQKKAL